MRPFEQIVAEYGPRVLRVCRAVLGPVEVEDAWSATVVYRTVDTPVGALLLAATDQGMVRVAYAREDHDRVLGKLAEAVSPRILNAPGRLDEVSRQLEEYFAGTWKWPREAYRWSGTNRASRGGEP